MSEIYKKTQKYLNVEQLLILASAITGCVSISSFSTLGHVPVFITTSAIWIKICVIAAGIKNYKSIIKNKKKNHDNIVFLGKNKLKEMV